MESIRGSVRNMRFRQLHMVVLLLGILVIFMSISPTGSGTDTATAAAIFPTHPSFNLQALIKDYFTMVMA